jgi:hypothetical protein
MDILISSTSFIIYILSVAFFISRTHSVNMTSVQVLGKYFYDSASTIWNYWVLSGFDKPFCLIRKIMHWV